MKVILPIISIVGLFLVIDISILFGSEELQIKKYRAANENSKKAYYNMGFESRFPIGVYVYGNKKTISELAEKRQLSFEQWLDACFKDLSEHHCNSVYLANLSSEPDAFKSAVAIAQKYKLAVFAQLTGRLYLRPKFGYTYYIEKTLKSIEKIIPQYKELTNVVAWMPKEEPFVDELDLLAEHRGHIRAIDNQHGIYTLHNKLIPLTQDRLNLPDWFGFDRYRFKSMFGKYGVMISTPKDMALRLRKELREFTAASAAHHRPLIFVIQGYGQDWFGTTESLLARTYGVIPKTHSGWQEIKPGQWFGWTKYSPPKYGMRLQCWLGILEGAKGLLIYKYRSRGKKIGERHVALVSEEGKAFDQWSEFGETISHLKPILPLARCWVKVSNDAVRTDHPEIFLNSFTDPNTKEHYIVVVNSRIAQWGKTSPRFLTQSSDLYFDNNGLKGLRPAGALNVKLFAEKELVLKDCISGEKFHANKKDSFVFNIQPGGGRVLKIDNGKI